MGIGKARGHVLEIGAQFSRNIVIGVAGADRVDIFRAALLRHLKASAQGGWQHGQAIRHHFGKHAGTLAAARHQNAENAIFGKGGKLLVPKRKDTGAHRIADEVGLAPVLCLQPVHIRIGHGNRIHAARQKTVHAAQHRVLFVNYRWNIHALRPQQGGQSGIPAEADDGGGPERLVQALRHRAPLHHRTDGGGPAQRVLAESARGQNVRGKKVWLAGNGLAPLVRNQRDMMAAPLQLVRKGEGRRQVAARSAGCQNEVARRSGHSSSSFSKASRTSKGSRARKGLRRVTASSKPIERHCAIVDEPP